MQNNEFKMVVDFLAKNQLINPNKINEEKTLNELGLDGDDVLDTIVDFFEEFNIEYKSTDYLKYIPDENIFFGNIIFSLFSKPKIDLSKEIQVKDLVHSLKIKKWEKLENYKEQ